MSSKKIVNRQSAKSSNMKRNSKPVSLESGKEKKMTKKLAKRPAKKPRAGRKQLKSVPVNRLKLHPLQEKFFGKVVHQHDVEALAANMKKHGQLKAIEITSDHEILCGRKRWLAAQHLGWNDIRCWVRDDLEAAGSDNVAWRMLDDNLQRTQLGPIGMARIYECYRQKLIDRPPGSGDLRDWLAKNFPSFRRLSGRQLDRYAALLELPDRLQVAVDAGDLTQQTATRLVKLDVELQTELAKLFLLRKG